MKKSQIIQSRLKTLEKERDDKLEFSKNMKLLDQFKTDYEKLHSTHEDVLRPKTERAMNKSNKNMSKMSCSSSSTIL